MAEENAEENIEGAATETVNDTTLEQVESSAEAQGPESEHDAMDTANIENRIDALEKSFAELKFMFDTLGFSPAENTADNDDDDDAIPSIDDLFNED